MYFVSPNYSITETITNLVAKVDANITCLDYLEEHASRYAGTLARVCARFALHSTSVRSDPLIGKMASTSAKRRLFPFHRSGQRRFARLKYIESKACYTFPTLR